ncbi:unnamed protein product [Linum tenue]|uniref:Protein phosphatase n=1 Tax=Linum tenue TaxID=586396 RepID=A0AAV0IPA8_9ROSI|nr:unnamed protein product [Linum tenue]
MTTPIFKASIPHSNPLFHSLHPVVWTSAVNGIPKKKKKLLLSGALLSPASLRYPLSISSARIALSTASHYHLGANTSQRYHSVLEVTSFNIPTRWKRAGKDAFFVSSYNGGVLAVADGVSGWAEEDVYPSLFFFRELIANASGFVPDDESRSTTIPKFSHQESTCCYLLNRLSYRVKIVAMLEGNGMLKFANVGDCGLKLIREGINLDSEMMSKNFLSQRLAV